MAEEKEGHVKVTLDMENKRGSDGHAKRKRGKHASHDSDDYRTEKEERVTRLKSLLNENTPETATIGHFVKTQKTQIHLELSLR